MRAPARSPSRSRTARPSWRPQINNPFITHRLRHVARLRPDDLRAPRDRQPGRQERDDPVARLEGQVELRLHAAHGHARATNVKWSDGKPFTADDIVFTFNLIKNTPALDLAGLKLDRRQEGRRQRRAELQRVEVRQAGRRAADRHRSRAPVEGHRRPVEGRGQGRRRHRPVHDQDLLVAGRRAQGPHRLLGRQGPGRPS